MLGLPLRYFLRNPGHALAAVAPDPLEIWTRVQESYVAQRERPIPPDLYRAEDDWERWMHERLGATSPCLRSWENWRLTEFVPVPTFFKAGTTAMPGWRGPSGV
jgi:hypothetical protein